jgi:hypothetical protein
MIDFNIKRFGKLLVWDLLSNKKRYTRYVVGIGIILATMFCVQLYTGLWEEKDYVSVGCVVWEPPTIHDLYEGIAASVFSLSLFWMAIGAVLIFEHTKTKQQRIAYLMLPASNLEKYLSRWLIYSVGFFLFLFLGLVIADIAQYLACIYFLNGAQESVTWNCLQLVYKTFSTPVRPGGHWDRGFGLLFLIAVHAYCTICGTFFRKNSMMMTVLLVYFLSVFGSITLFSLLFAFFSDNRDIIIDDLSTAYYLVFYTILIAFSAAAYFLSYKIFTRMQVVGRKWINI